MFARFRRVTHLTAQESTRVIALSVRSCRRNIQQDRITNTSRLRYPSVLSSFGRNIRLIIENADKATILSFFQPSVGSAAKS